MPFFQKQGDSLMNKIKIAAILFVLTIASLNINAAQKALSPKAKDTFDQITKLWNSKEKNIKDFDKNVINTGMNNVSEAIDKSVKNVTVQIPLTELLNLIKTLKEQRATFKPISTKLSAETAQALKNIFDTTKDFYKKLLETQKIAVKARTESELFGQTTSLDKLAQGLLVIIKDTIANHNMNPSLLPFKLTDKEYEQEKKAFEKLEDTKLYEVTIKR